MKTIKAGQTINKAGTHTRGGHDVSETRGEMSRQTTQNINNDHTGETSYRTGRDLTQLGQFQFATLKLNQTNKILYKPMGCLFILRRKAKCRDKFKRGQLSFFLTSVIV